MDNFRKAVLKSVGQRLKEIRIKLNYTPDWMASKLEIDRTTYYRDENGESLPGLESLNYLHKYFGVSMDWFLFGTGPMYYKEKEQAKPPEVIIETKPHPLEELMPDVKELWDYMVQDPQLRHETMLNFYKYKERKENKPQFAPPAMTE
jgi:transcriptional regulator with XRE-family HTH domain